MQEKNATVLKLISLVIALVTLGIAVVIAFKNVDYQARQNTKDIQVIIPQVNQNTEYRITDKIDTLYIKAKLDDIETVQEKILEEVKKQ